ncbi:MAG: hypothetical protein ACQEQU_03895 [Spirochaetota bacterium]
MKYKVFVLLLLIVCATGAVYSAHADWTAASHSDARISGLGQAYTAVADDSNTIFLNPAGLRLLADADFSLRADFEDFLPDSVLSDMSLSDFPQEPTIDGEFLYTARNWGLAASTAYHLSPVSDGRVDIKKANSLHFGAAFGAGPLSVGANIKATKYDEKDNVELAGSDLGSIALPFLRNVVFAEYLEEPSESVTMGLGALLTMGKFSFGAYSDNFIDFMHTNGNGESGINMDLEAVFSKLSAGVAYQGTKYDSFGNYHPLQVVAAVDVHNLGDNADRLLSMGVEANLRFIDFAQLALRLGFQQEVTEWRDIMYGPQLTEGDYTVGAGVVLPFVKIDASTRVPATALAYALEPSGAYEGDPVRAQLTFGFSF